MFRTGYSSATEIVCIREREVFSLHHRQSTDRERKIRLTEN